MILRAYKVQLDAAITSKKPAKLRIVERRGGYDTFIYITLVVICKLFSYIRDKLSI